MNDTDKPIIHKNTNLRLSWFKARDKIKCFVITMHLIHSIKMLTQFSLKKKISFKINLFFFMKLVFKPEIYTHYHPDGVLWLLRKYQKLLVVSPMTILLVSRGLWRWILLNPISPDASLAKQRNNPILVLSVKNKNYHWGNEVIRQRNEF